MLVFPTMLERGGRNARISGDQPMRVLAAIALATVYENRAATIGELQRVLPLAGDDAVHMRVWPLHRRQTSGLRAICCSHVPRYSRASAALCATMPPIESARPSAIRVQFAYPPILHVSLKGPQSMRWGKVLGRRQNVEPPTFALACAIPKINFFDRSRKGSILYALADGNKAGTVLNNENV
jgi:hypothetical protein